jgi:glycosyltransferase involved in cell wall biosynthesis
LKIIFPLPIAYDGTEPRYLQRDGARFAQYMVAQGHEAVKIIVDDGSGYPPPKSPILGIATWKQWCSTGYWKAQKADGVLLYGGFNPRLAPVARAIRDADIPLALKMDSSSGVQAFPKDAWRQLKTGYHFAHQNHNKLKSALISFARQGIRAVRGTKRLKSYLSLFDWITGESRFAVENTKTWLVENGLEQLAERTVLLGHPVPDEFKYNASSPPKRKQIIAVARDWKNPLKGGKLLGHVLAKTLARHPDYSAVIIGESSDLVRQTVVRLNTKASDKILVKPLMEPLAVRPHYLDSQILVCPSGSESGPIVAFEAACCGCSVVFPPELRQLAMFSDDNCGTMAKRRTPKGLSDALARECEAWERHERDPLMISKLWCTKFHTSELTGQLIGLFM